MKNLLNLSSSKIFLVCGLSLSVSLGFFWHLQLNQNRLDKINTLNQGVHTCFNRISQTFTALMIKDIQSSYLNKSFMNLSEECFKETAKGIGPFKNELAKGHEVLMQLISEVNWFHETVAKFHASLVAKQTITASFSPLTDRYGKVEGLKMDLSDEMEIWTLKLRTLQRTDEVFIGLGFIFLVLALGLLSYQHYQFKILQKKIEASASNLLNSGKNHLGAMVDQLIDDALTSNHLIVTSQVFRDYHEGLLEGLAVRSQSLSQDAIMDDLPSPDQVSSVAEVPDEKDLKTSLREVLVSIQNAFSDDVIQFSDVRDVILNIPHEILEQIVSSAINQLSSRRIEDQKILITNQIHADKSVLNIFLAGSTFSEEELNFASNNSPNTADTVGYNMDVNLLILKEMVSEAEVKWKLENKVDRSGAHLGTNIRFTIKRSSKEKTKLIALSKGKKKNLLRELI